jgi:hypothetical protein
MLRQPSSCVHWPHNCLSAAPATSPAPRLTGPGRRPAPWPLQPPHQQPSTPRADRGPTAALARGRALIKSSPRGAGRSRAQRAARRAARGVRSAGERRGRGTRADGWGAAGARGSSDAATGARGPGEPRGGAEGGTCIMQGYGDRYQHKSSSSNSSLVMCIVRDFNVPNSKGHMNRQKTCKQIE